MQEALGESLAWRAIATATRGQGKKKRKESKSSIRKEERNNKRKSKNGWTIERKKGMQKMGNWIELNLY